jgi:3-deoxy-D-manno-octulosonate 8-phosphate phosphatase (KDO 8-P phosphatase)
MKKSLVDKIKKIRLLIVDVDGILTDGKIIVDHKGNENKEFDVQDGFGLVLFKRMGFKTALLSARSTDAVTARAKDLRIDKIYQDAYPKIGGYIKILKELKLKDEQVCFMGDDLPDLEVLRKVGFAVTVPNGREELKRTAHYITKNRGGQGAVREVIEIILKTQKLWGKVLSHF